MSSVEKRFSQLVERKERIAREHAEVGGQIKGIHSELQKLGVSHKELDKVIADLSARKKKRLTKLEKALTEAEGVLDECESAR